MGNCVCGYISINGVCVDEDCNSKNIINIDPTIDESNSFGDSNIDPNIVTRSGNSVDSNIAPNIDPNIDPIIDSIIDPIFDPIMAPEQVAPVAFIFIVYYIKRRNLIMFYIKTKYCYKN